MNSLKKLKDMLMALDEKGAKEVAKEALKLLAEPLGYQITPSDDADEPPPRKTGIRSDIENGG